MDKYNNIVLLANETLKNISKNEEEWLKYLKTSSRLYKYSFDEQLLIYAQRPDATACASIEVWNSKMNLYVKRGSKGIAIIDKISDKPKLKYLFDISDVQALKNGPGLYLWAMKDEHQDNIINHLEKLYGFSCTDNILFGDKIIELSKQIVEENYHDYSSILNELKDNSLLEELDIYNVDLIYKELLSSSIAYSLLIRCDIDVNDYMNVLNFENISMFNTVETLTQLGNASSVITKPILMEIGKAINVYENSINKKIVDKYSKIDYNALKRKSEHITNNEERRNPNEYNISEERGLSNTESSDGRATNEHNREIWANEKELSNESQIRSLPESITNQQIELSFNRDKQRSIREHSDISREDEKGTENNRRYERTESNGMGSEDEQYSTFSRGNSDNGTYTQLVLFPTIEQQIDAIEIGANNKAPFSLDKTNTILPKYSYLNPKIEKEVSHNYVIDVLKRGSGFQDGKLRIYEMYNRPMSKSDRSKLIKKEYGLGGCGWPIKGYGLHGYDSFKSKGLSIRWKDKEGEKEGYLSWSIVEKEIGNLISTNNYITLEEIDNYNRKELAKSIENLDIKNSSPAAEQNKITDSAITNIISEDADQFEDINKAEDTIITENINKSEIIDNDNSLEFSNFPFNSNIEPVINTVKKYNTDLNNFKIVDENINYGNAKAKYGNNIVAIKTLFQIEKDNRLPTLDEQNKLSKYVGWGGLSQAFDRNNTSWTNEFNELENLLDTIEYSQARESTLNAHYTSPVIIKSMFNLIERFGFKEGNMLEPALGIGNFFGMIPESISNAKLYGIELDGITGRIAKYLYPNSTIEINGFEHTSFPDDLFDVAIGNVPFGNYKVADRKYDKYNYLIHDYFFAKTLDKVRPGGIIAFITTKGTLDKQNSEVRKYIAQRAELLGAVRLPNNAFLSNAGTEVTSDIIILQKRERIVDIEPDWVHLGINENDIKINQYFIEHPDMILGKMENVMGPYGPESTCTPLDGQNLSEQLSIAMNKIDGTIDNSYMIENSETDITSIPADPSVKNFSFTIFNDDVYYRENSLMILQDLSENNKERVKSLINLRDCTRELINYQLEEYSNEEIKQQQNILNALYEEFSKKYGLINNNLNKKVFIEDSSYHLLCSLEILNEDGTLKRKADIFNKRTIKQKEFITSVDTASEALAVSISHKACIDLEYMNELIKTHPGKDEIINSLLGVIYKNPLTNSYETSDEYLSGNVREKLSIVTELAKDDPSYTINVQALTSVQPKDLDASEIEVRLGSTWVDKNYIEEFMMDLLKTPKYLLKYGDISISYSKVNGTWNVLGKSADRNNIIANVTYGTKRINAYRIIEDTLNLKDVRIFDTKIDGNGKEYPELNKQETLLAQQKQDLVKQQFKDWIFKDPIRREYLCKKYNELFNSIRPREYDGSHILFSGMNNEIQLNTHQVNAVARQLYGNNTLLAHCVGAGKTFEMTAAAMESKRLGLNQKSLFVVPNHLTEQWASDFLTLYPGANILAATKKDFEPSNRKKFCSRIATGEYDAIIIGHSQFEKIPLSVERQSKIIQNQIDDITLEISDIKAQKSENFTIKQMEKTKKSLAVRLEKLNDTSRKDNVITFEELGVDKLFVDEAHSYKNLFLYTKMRNVAGISQSEAQKSSDMFSKCQYMDEITGNKGITFATGTPISNSMTELYTMMRYLQFDTLQNLQLGHFDSWASSFGETVTAIELTPEGTGYRAKTRFSKFYNLPELINIFKEVADIQTSDMLKLPIPEVEYINCVIEPSQYQKDIIQSLSERAEKVRNREVEPHIDNMLKITNDGRKLALDQRLINPLLPEEEQSKVKECAKNVYEIWKKTKYLKSTQLFFSDLSTPKGDGNFNVYDDLKNNLIKMGIPSNEIAFIHDAKTELKKAVLFQKVRQGSIRVLMGSTSKMGAGTNVQNKLIALHRLDVPWKPSDIEQSEGRILRQGNENKQVEIFKYITKGTFDAYSWQLIENKQKFISQIMTSKSPVRSCEDMDESTLSYAEIKALATGNPYIKEKMDLDIQVSRLTALKANYTSQQYSLEDNINKYIPQKLQALNELIKGLEMDIKLYQQNFPSDFKMQINSNEIYDKKVAGEEIINICKSLTSSCLSKEIGKYCGFNISISYDVFKQEFTMNLQNSITHKVKLGSDQLGNLTRIDNNLSNMPKRLDIVNEDLKALNEQLINSKVELGKPFVHEEELKNKLSRLNELNSILNMQNKSESLDPSIKKDIINEIKKNNFIPNEKVVNNIYELTKELGYTPTLKNIKELSCKNEHLSTSSTIIVDNIVNEFKEQELKSLKLNYLDLEI